MNVITKTIRKIVRNTGFDVVRFHRDRIGRNPFADIQHFLKGQQSPIIFDVGANIGQSVDKFRSSFPAACIHSFEPSRSTYQQLQRHCENLPGVKTWNVAVGSSDTTLPLIENDSSDMSSFLPPSTHCWGNIINSTEVQVVTLDSFTKEQNIDFIHILKSDTQGYDFEVFKGANQLMMEQRVGLVYFEFIFSDMYKGLPFFDEVLRYLRDHDFALVAIYDQYFQDELVSWADALFIHRGFKRNALRMEGNK